MGEISRNYGHDKEIIRYLSDELTGAEEAEFQEKLMTSPELKARFEELSTFWANDGNDYYSEKTNRGWDDWKKSIGRPMTRKKSRLIGFWRSVAAIFLGLLAVGIWRFMKVHTEQTAYLNDLEPIEHNEVTLELADGGKLEITQGDYQDLMIDSARSAKQVGGFLIYKKNKDINPNRVVAFNTLTVPRGKRFNVMLSDGTRVWLNSDSRLSYPVEFTGTKREIKLTGEAYLEVAKNENKPFIIRAANIDVRVYGTAFNIKAYSEDKEVSTVLVEGKVGIAKRNGSAEFDEDNAVMMSPYQRVVYNDESGRLVKTTLSDIDRYTAWKDNRLVFYNEKFENLKPRLERWYNIRVIDDAIGFSDERFSGEFESEQIEKVMNFFAVTSPITVMHTNDTFYIKDKD
ncbi:FecR family protein [Fulvitalea axinellae]